MPILKNYMGRQLARRIKASLGQSATKKFGQAYRQDEQVDQKLAKLERENAALRVRLGERDQDGGVRPENVVWIFGSGRTGSTWLSSMMGALPDHARWGTNH